MIKLEQYRDEWLAENVSEFIGFYNREFFCLDNFSSFGFMYDGVYYQTVEHAYQSLRFKNIAPEIEKKIIQCYSAYEAQKIAYDNIDKQVPNWGTIKVLIMENLLKAKLGQNPYVKKKLLQTKNYLICEDSPKDSFWGIGPDRNGQNQLGKLWMKLRDEIGNDNSSMGSVEMRLADGPFEKIKSGEKNVEIRLYDEKRR